jgi:hypothetical protein
LQHRRVLPIALDTHGHAEIAHSYRIFEPQARLEKAAKRISKMIERIAHQRRLTAIARNA